ncbi:PREDICTED: uncharacterized protein LOC104605067 isoform X2 [Nelumbo nucifera]|uniref:Protein EFR3 homolog B n=2 Tax=Nelumbo nucifera TaxID=4432 RepID=A0A822YV34_NELNU|nr:PREDICTED: uncharacterized protein LOC104605067 isoform X2 [Nelumbo nucifera]DAD33118.1 TPA_asm: hypothetical protein HUJ06_011969 [Nelumbo nucifera]
MGFISRKVLPVCGNMCVCCPALRSRSRQPTKRYKKLLSEIFPKSLDGPPNERKIVKLCEYASRNPIRIPKIAKYLEQRIYKELRSEHIKFVNVIMEAYNKLLCMCKEQMAYFALSLLNVVIELLDNTKQDVVRILGCQILARFIYSQADSTYTHNIEGLVHKVCSLACESGEERSKQCLRASSLQCLSSMMWFMGEFSHVFDDFDEIVHAILDNYDPDMHLEGDNERGELQHNWVDEVVRCEAGVGGDLSPNHIIRPRPEKKDFSLLTREEIETPKIWAQICIQRVVELAKESTTMRRVLDPMFIYFDTKRKWVPRQGLSVVVLSDMCYFAENPGSEQLILASVIRHLDHKNVSHDRQVKSDIIQIAATLARQIRTQTMVAEIGIISDLCRHLRKSLQAKAELVGQQEANLNISLQNSIEDCLLEIAKGIGDARPLFDMMAIALEKLPPVGVVARATIGSLLILAHIISLASTTLQLQQTFPDALLLQLLKTMVHPDTEARVGAHQIFATLLVPTSNHPKHEIATVRSGYPYEPKRWQSKTAFAFASTTALLERLRREKDGMKFEKHRNSLEDSKDREPAEEDWKQGWTRKNSPNFYKLNCYRTAGSACFPEAEPNIVKLSEDQTAQLLSAFWLQANLPDNLPSNFEAIAHSFCLTLICSHLKNPNHNIAVRFFQLPLSLRNISLDPCNGMLPVSCQRSLFVLATAILMFAAKIYHISDLNDLLKSSVPNDVDPFLSIGDDLQLYTRPQADLREYGSATDYQAAMTLLAKLREESCESNKTIQDILVPSLSNVTELDMDDLARQLSEVFTPDDVFMFAPQSALGLCHLRTICLKKESHPDGEPTSSSEDDALSDSSNRTGVMPRTPTSPSLSHIISVGQLVESALEVAGQVAGTSVSTSPLPYSAMASQCEALGTGTRKKLSSWLAHETPLPRAGEVFSAFPSDGQSAIRNITIENGGYVQGILSTEQWSSMRLPPASPFDNFLKAAGC